MPMKKLFLCFAVMAICLSACDEDEPDWRLHRPDYFQDDHRPDSQNGSNSDAQNSSQEEVFSIVKLYSVVMRRELPYPFKAYVLQINNGEYFYMLRYRYNADLHVGDKISFAVYTYCPNEIARINGCELGDGSDYGETTDGVDAGEYLVASDPIEATVKNMFAMKIRYSLTFVPIDTWFIETTDGKLIFIKKSKLNVTLKAGDRIVYNVYTLFPNEVLALKKL